MPEGTLLICTAVLCPALFRIQHHKLKVLFYGVVTTQRGIRERTEVWLGVLETVNVTHITTASGTDSSVTHVFLHQFKWSPRINRQR